MAVCLASSPILPPVETYSIEERPQALLCSWSGKVG